jgi:hypothetical protein
LHAETFKLMRELTTKTLDPADVDLLERIKRFDLHSDVIEATMGDHASDQRSKVAQLMVSNVSGIKVVRQCQSV